MFSIEGDNLQFCPNFALFSTLGGINLDYEFVQVSKLSEDQKQGLYQKWNTFFPRIQVDTYAQMHARVKLLGGYRGVFRGGHWAMAPLLGRQDSIINID